jgi:hypothetical protein
VPDKIVNSFIILVVDTEAGAIVAVGNAILVTADAVPGPGVTNVAEDRAGGKLLMSNDVVELLNKVHNILAIVPSL